MKAVIIYESMYGNTRTIAYAISEGLRPVADVTVASATQAGQELLRSPIALGSANGWPAWVRATARPWPSIPG
jgi:flavodoxin